MGKEEKINFSLQQIKNEQFAILEENYSETKPTELVTAINFEVDTKNQLIRALISITFEQSKKAFLKIDMSCHFKIEGNSWANFISKKESVITIPKGFLAHLAMITVGTSRGVLFSKTEGTVFSKFIIPTIDVASMIEKDAKVPLENK